MLLPSPPPSLSLLRCSLTPGPPPSTGHGAAPDSTRACLRKPKREKQSEGSPGSPVRRDQALASASWTVGLSRAPRGPCQLRHLARVVAHCPPNGDGRLAIVRRIWDKGVCAHRPRTSGTCGGRARGGIDDSSLARTVRPRARVFLFVSENGGGARVPVTSLRPRRCSESLVGRFRVCGRF